MVRYTMHEICKRIKKGIGVIMKHKIAIIGYSGSGKSTLAQKLGERYECEVLHLDRLHWLPGWKERENGESNAILSEFMDAQDNWVIDGNYSSLCYQRRMEEATEIIYLEFPMGICLYRALKRYHLHRGKSRDSMTEGCEEKIDREFLWWILHEGRDKAHRQRHRKVCKTYEEKSVILRSPKAVRKYLKNHGI